MTTKSLLIVGALALGSLSVAGAKSYDILLDGPTRVGSTQLKPGQYKVKVDGSQVVFTDATSEKSVTAAAKIASNDKKFEHTTVQTNSQNGVDNLQEIDLGGSTTKLQFDE